MSSSKETVVDFWITNDIQKRFLKDAQVSACLEEFLSKSLSIKIKIDCHSSTKDSWWRTRGSTMVRVQLIDGSQYRPDMRKAFHDLLKQFLTKIQLKVYNRDDKVVQLLRLQTMVGTRMNLLQTLINRRINDIISVLVLKNYGLYVYYLPKKPFGTIDAKNLTYFIENEVSLDVIQLPPSYERSLHVERELREIISREKENNEIFILFNGVLPNVKRQEIILYGYRKKVIKIKKEILNVFEKNTLIAYKLNFKSQQQIEAFTECHSNPLKSIERLYNDYGVKLQLESNEFLAPEHIKNDIESYIEEILSEVSTNKTFETIELCKDIAIKEEQHLRIIAERYKCYIKTELKHNCQSYPVPKALISNTQVSQSIFEQSKQFYSSTDVLKKMIVANGSIELRIGDIALQETDVIVISTTFNGLKEGVIERLGEIQNEVTYIDVDGTMYTETNGGKLNCKRILFSNWLPISLINNDQILRSSIRKFVTKSMEYITKEKATKSIAFAIPDTSTDETILAEIMVAEIKRHLETNKLPLKIVFVCLPEQENLYQQFSNLIPTMKDNFMYLDYPTT
ncbi:unnamed protein product, partial [Rotaria sordida]